MRQRSLAQRIFTAFFGLWFSVVVAEPLPLHVCPMHDGPLAYAAAHHAQTVPDVASAPAGHAAMHHALQSHEEPATDSPAGHGAHQCQCLGCCAGTSATALPGAPVINVQATLAAVQVRGFAAHNAMRAPVRFAHALPFANGPPSPDAFLRG